LELVSRQLFCFLLGYEKKAGDTERGLFAQSERESNHFTTHRPFSGALM
jgi:hypothetical protein